MVAQETCSWVGVVTLVLLPLLFPCVARECSLLDQDTILINDLKEMKNSLCYKCYEAPMSHRLQVQLRRVRLKGLSSIMIYMGDSSNPITEDCGDCQEGTACQECKELSAERMFELYLRQNTALKLDEGQNACEYIASFNITLNVISDEPEMETSPDCDGGFLVNFPQSGDSCIINTTLLGMEPHCLMPTCSEGILASSGLTEKMEHTFKRTSLPETCIWKLNTEQRKHLTLTFSQDIRPHLTVFEGSLMNPRWDMEWCPAYSNNYKLETEANTVFVVYHNTNPLTKKGSLTITSQAAVCLIPPPLEHGNVEFKRLDSGMVALYSCDHGYTLIGPPKLRCKDGAWSDPPVCLHDKATPEEVAEEAIEMAEEEKKEKEAKEMEGVTSEPDMEGEMEEEGAEKEEEEEKEKLEEAEELDSEIYTPSTSDIDLDNEDYPTNDTMDHVQQPSVNTSETSSAGGIFTGLLNLNLEEDLKLYVIIGGAGLTALILLLIISVVIYRKRYPMRLGLGRRFDTFQNPIYEKAVVRVPLQVEEPPPEEKKASDAEEISNCTVLEP